MPTTYLLDANVIIESGRVDANPRLLARLVEHKLSCATSATVLHELRFGVERMVAGARRTAFERLIDRAEATMPILPYDDAAARWHATERHRRDRSGRRLPFADGQIAAVAATRGLVVVTHNAADFKDLAGVVVEDWTEP